MAPDPIEDLASVDLPLKTDVVAELMDKARSLPALTEAHAGAAIFALMATSRLATSGDVSGVEAELAKVPTVFDKMIKSFRRITERCDTMSIITHCAPICLGLTAWFMKGWASSAVSR